VLRRLAHGPRLFSDVESWLRIYESNVGSGRNMRAHRWHWRPKGARAGLGIDRLRVAEAGGYKDVLVRARAILIQYKADERSVRLICSTARYCVSCRLLLRRRRRRRSVSRPFTYMNAVATERCPVAGRMHRVVEIPPRPDWTRRRRR
jgi:hypothetical protein